MRIISATESLNKCYFRAEAKDPSPPEPNYPAPAPEPVLPPQPTFAAPLPHHPVMNTVVLPRAQPVRIGGVRWPPPSSPVDSLSTTPSPPSSPPVTEQAVKMHARTQTLLRVDYFTSLLFDLPDQFSAFGYAIVTGIIRLLVFVSLSLSVSISLSLYDLILIL